MVTLPKGKWCQLTPTANALKNGFYSLQNIKLVLEQSLSRTRATLTVGDVVHTWHRGIKYDLVVSKVKPSTFNAVTCINTDIEVEFGTPKRSNDDDDDSNNMLTSPGVNKDDGSNMMDATSASAGGSGRVLAFSEGKENPHQSNASSWLKKLKRHDLPQEPSPGERADKVCVVQIRAFNGKQGKRLFLLDRTTVKDLFAFALSIMTTSSNDDDNDVNPFQLVTRFPRRVLCYEINAKEQLLSDVGIGPGQELFMVEKLS